MDDLKLLEDLRRETPPMTAAAAQTARARLLAAATAEPPGTRPWRSALRNGLSRAAWRVAIAATLGVALTATATVTRDLDVDPQRPQQARSSAGLLPAGVANAAELGDRAATVMAAQLDLSPRPHQWVYLEQRQATLNGDHWWSGVGPGRVTTRMWKRVDGKRLAFERKGGGLRFQSGAFAVGRPQLHVNDLPTDPDALLPRIRREVAGAGSVERRRQAMFTLIGMLLRDNILPPRVQAAMYQALPKIPGVRLQQDAVDAAGRHVVAFARVTPGTLGFPLRLRFEIILDPANVQLPRRAHGRGQRCHRTGWGVAGRQGHRPVRVGPDRRGDRQPTRPAGLTRWPGGAWPPGSEMGEQRSVAAVVGEGPARSGQHPGGVLVDRPDLVVAAASPSWPARTGPASRGR